MIATIVILLLLSVLILIHELGHFIVAKREGVKVEEFGFGFPPKLWSKKVGETIYSINWIPFGGFVRMLGENEDDKSPRAFSQKGVWARIRIVVAGVVCNYVFAFLVFIIVPLFGFVSVAPDKLPASGSYREIGIMVLDVAKSSPAETASVARGDIIKEIDGKPITGVQAVIDYLKSKPGMTVSVVIDRKGERKELTITPRPVVREGEGPTGMMIATTGVLKYGFPQGLIEGAQNFWYTTVGIVSGLYELVRNLIIERKATGDLAGPVGILSLGGNFFYFGFSSLLHFIAILSINLAILNLLPIPALDGGRLIFLLFEAITGRRMNDKKEAIFHKVGFMLLIALLIFITIRDVQKMF